MRCHDVGHVQPVRHKSWLLRRRIVSRWRNALAAAACGVTVVYAWSTIGSNWDYMAGEPICSAAQEPWRSSKLNLSLPALRHITFSELSERYGHLHVFVAESSTTNEDTTDMENGGLDEKGMLFATFLHSAEAGKPLKHNYWKVLDRPSRRSLAQIGLEDLLPFGTVIEHELRRALLSEAAIHAPTSVSWSLWIGGTSSTTALHVDDTAFNVLAVLHGTKRMVLVDPADHEFACSRPLENPGACWAGIDVLSDPLPSFAHEVILRAGEAILLPELWWHAVENLEPTIAVGVNSHDACVGRRFAALRPRS